MNPRYSFLATWLLAALNSRLGFSATGREIGFVENFALADDRSAALGQLIPGTEEHFYYTALNLQNQGKTADLKVLLGQWAERIPNSPLRAQIGGCRWEAAGRLPVPIADAAGAKFVSLVNFPADDLDLTKVIQANVDAITAAVG